MPSPFRRFLARSCVGAWSLACLVTATASAASLYLSPSGDDHNPGTEEAPVKTIARAQALVRAASATQDDDITVYVGGGLYRLDRPLTFSAEDSGRNGFSIVYLAPAGERPVISGAVRVQNWRLVDKARNLWSAPAPDGLSYTRQLYVDGVRALRARGRLPVALLQTPTGYTASDSRMASWRNPGDIEFVYTGGNSLWSEHSSGLGPWTEPRCPVGSITGTAIVMAQPAWSNCTERVMYPDPKFKRPANLVGPAAVGKEPEYVENAYELLGTPGQWYFDRAAHQLYYTPRVGENLATADVEAPVLETLVEGLGTPERPVENIVFKGIEFSYATWLSPSSKEGFPEIQANYPVTGERGYAVQGLGDLVPGGTKPYGAWTREHGNVRFAYAHGVQFFEDAFVHLGGAGLDLGNGAQRDRVEGCIFTDISGNGLNLGGVDEPLADDPRLTRDNQIVDNHFYNIATEYHGGIAIVIGYAQRTLVQYNQIDHVPYAAISVGWGGWPDKVKKPGVANVSRGNVIANNRIEDLMLLLADGGGIYTQGITGPTLEDGEQVVANVITRQYGSGHAIYSDNGSCNMTIEGNIMVDTNHDNWGSHHADYYDGADGKTYDPIRVLNNAWEQGTPDSREKGLVLSGNRLITRIDEAPAQLLAKAGIETTYREVLSRRFATPAAPEAPQRVAVATYAGRALVSWNPPSNEGSEHVTAYTVNVSSGQKVTVSAADYATRGYVLVDGLELGVPISVSVTATNAVGISPPSLPSATVTPSRPRRVKLPKEPHLAEVFQQGSRASIHLQAPESDGGSPIIDYVVTIGPGERKVILQGRRFLTLSGAHTTFATIEGLDPKTAATFTVAAETLVGVGPETEASVTTLAP